MGHGIDRMQTYVLRQLRRHPALTPIREVGHIVFTIASAERIEAHSIYRAGDPPRFQLTARVRAPEWWDPATSGESFEEKGDRIAEHLASELRRQWDEAQKAAIEAAIQAPRR